MPPALLIGVVKSAYRCGKVIALRLLAVKNNEIKENWLGEPSIQIAPFFPRAGDEGVLLFYYFY